MLHGRALYRITHGGSDSPWVLTQAQYSASEQLPFPKRARGPFLVAEVGSHYFTVSYEIPWTAREDLHETKTRNFVKRALQQV
jgi:hypothetical protein